LGFGRLESLHDMHWPYQLYIRHRYVPRDVVGVQVSGFWHGVVVPVGLVRRGFALANTHRTHDTYTQGAVRSEFGFVARNAHDVLYHGCGHLYTIHTVRQFDRSHAAPSLLLPVACRHSVRLLRAHAVAQDTLHPRVQALAINRKRVCQNSLLLQADTIWLDGVRYTMTKRNKWSNKIEGVSKHKTGGRRDDVCRQGASPKRLIRPCADLVPIHQQQGWQLHRVQRTSVLQFLTF